MDDNRSRSKGTAQEVEVLLDSARDLVRMLGSLSDASVNQASAMADLELENRDFSARLVELEQQKLDLVKLYVASHQLHSTLEMEEVLKTAVEIVINLIGGAKIAIYTLAGLFVGVAGVFKFARLSIGDPTAGLGMELQIIAAVVIGSPD